MKYLILVILLSGCTVFGSNKTDGRIVAAVEDIIEQERKHDLKVDIPILEIYMLPCKKPNAPADSYMVSYEIALRDSVVSFKECNDKYETLIQKIKEKEVTDD